MRKIDTCKKCFFKKPWCSLTCKIISKIDITVMPQCWTYKVTTKALMAGSIISWNNKKITAHRYLYQKQRHPLKPDEFIINTCSNRYCIFPWHKRVLNKKEYYSHVSKEKKPKLTDKDFEKIKHCKIELGWPNTHIAHMFNVSETAIRKMLHKKITKDDITEPDRYSEFDSFL